MMLNSGAQEKVLTMEDAVLGYHLYPKNLSLQWQGEKNVFTYAMGPELIGENADGGEKKVIMTVDELNRILGSDLKGWPQYT